MRTTSRSICPLEPRRRVSRAHVSRRGGDRESKESLRKTLEAMNRHNIVLGFLSSPDLKVVQEWVAAAPGRFIASPFIEKPGDLSPQMLRQEYAAGRLAGMGEIGSQLLGVAPNDPALAPYFALAEEFDVPVLIHTAGIGPPVAAFRSAAGRPLLLEECWLDIASSGCSSRTAGTRSSTR